MKTKTRAMGRVYRRGSRFWMVLPSWEGDPGVCKGTTSETKALKLLRQRQRETGADHLGPQQFIPRQDRIFVSDLLDSLRADFQLREVRGLKKALCHLKPVREFFGDMRAIQVSEIHIDRYIESRLAMGKAPGTVNRETQLLSQAFRKAVQGRRLSSAPHIRNFPN